MTARPLTTWQYPSIKIYSQLHYWWPQQTVQLFLAHYKMKWLKKLHQKNSRYHPSNYTLKRIFVSSIPQLACFINNWHPGKTTLCEVGTQVPLNLAHHSLFMSNDFKYLQHCLQTCTSLQTHTPLNSQYSYFYQPLQLKHNLRGWRTALTASSEYTIKFQLSAVGNLLLRGDRRAWRTVHFKSAEFFTRICFHTNGT